MYQAKADRIRHMGLTAASLFSGNPIIAHPQPQVAMYDSDDFVFHNPNDITQPEGPDPNDDDAFSGSNPNEG